MQSTPTFTLMETASKSHLVIISSSESRIISGLRAVLSIRSRCALDHIPHGLVHFSSVAHLCLTPCNPLACSTSGLLVHHQLLELAQTHVHQVSDPIQPSHPLSSLSPAFNLSQHQGLFQWVSSFISGGQSIGASGSASVLPMNIQDWFLLGLTGLIFLLSKGLSRVFSNTTVKNINFSTFSLPYGLTLTSIHDYWKNHSFD